MSDGGINERYKARFAAAQAEYGGRYSVPRDVVQKLQEELRLEWVKHVKGDIKMRAARTTEPPPKIEPEPKADVEVDETIAPADTFKTRKSRKATKKTTKARATKKTTKRKRK